MLVERAIAAESVFQTRDHFRAALIKKNNEVLQEAAEAIPRLNSDLKKIKRQQEELDRSLGAGPPV